jgi:hypothetical protein
MANMKTIVVISDTHGNRTAMEGMNNIFKESDYIVHLGDTSSDGNALKKEYPNKTYLLNGNCDIARFGSQEIIMQVEDTKIFACHGDAYGVKSDLSRLAYKAKQEGCSVALYGHTHHAGEDQMAGVTLYNPGTLSRFSRKSYLYLVVNGKKAVGKIVELNN